MLGRLLQYANSSGNPEEFRMSLVEHLEDLRKRIIRCMFILGAAWMVAWFVYNPLYDHLNSVAIASLPKGLKYQEVFLSVIDPFMLKLKLSFYFGLVVALPFVVLQLWGFVAPGLKPRERKPFKVIGPLSVFLFALGCFFCWLIIPTTIQWFASVAMESYKDIQINQEPGRLIFFIVNMMLAFGLGFQLPLIVYFIAKVGILPVESLNQYWRHAVVIIFFAAAILTPSNDPISMLMMAIPLCVLFVISVLAVKWTTKPLPEDEYEVVEEPEPIVQPKASSSSVPFTAAVEEDEVEPD